MNEVTRIKYNTNNQRPTYPSPSDSRQAVSGPNFCTLLLSRASVRLKTQRRPVSILKGKEHGIH